MAARLLIPNRRLFPHELRRRVSLLLYATTQRSGTSREVEQGVEVMRRLKSCRSCGHSVDWEAKTCPGCGAKHPGMSQITYTLIGLFALLLVGTCAFSALSEENSFQWVMKPGETTIEWDRRLDSSVRERIECSGPSFLVRVVVPEGSYELMALDQSRITMCGWKTNMFEMFVVDRGGCVVRKKHRWQMNNVDAKRVRECFDK